jgi:chromosomal replication initiator protein
MIEFVQAMRSNEMLEFKARLRGFDLLLVDDIQFIIGKARRRGGIPPHDRLR